MSVLSVETIFSRAMSDPGFTDSLFANPEQALAGYDLTVDETTALKGMSRADVAAFGTASPEERRSFAWTGNHNETALTAPV